MEWSCVTRRMVPTLHRLVFLFSLIALTRQLDLEECSGPLGMESGDITDDAITVSSSFDQESVGRQHARLNVDEAGGAWCPEHPISEGSREYLEIDLGSTHVLTAVSVQGRFGNGQGREYADNFTLEYMRPGQTDWRAYRLWDGRQVLPGNTNTYLAVRRELWPPVVTAKLRVLPYTYRLYARMVCMRVELHGCSKSDGLASYSLPQGASQQWFGVDLTDRTYDGAEHQGQLYGGVGQLNDGAYGADDFRSDLGHGRGFEWVGWRDSTADGLLKMTFEFDSVRNFSDLFIHASADRQENIGLFSRVAVTGSIGGRFYNSPPVLYYTLSGGELFLSRNVSVPLSGLVARFLRVQLSFAAEWILVSEVAFNSEPAEGSFTEETGLISQPDISVYRQGLTFGSEEAAFSVHDQLRVAEPADSPLESSTAAWPLAVETTDNTQPSTAADTADTQPSVAADIAGTQPPAAAGDADSC